MNILKTTALQAAAILILVTPFASGQAFGDDYFPFRVSFENVPGTDELTAGQISQGIARLTDALNTDSANKGFVLATLCGAYILQESLEKAASICDEAVTSHPGETAFNNRGVLRVFTGDFAGAKNDFDRARPEHMAEYLEQLKTQDVGLVADENFRLIESLAAKHSPLDVESSMAAKASAKIEEMDQ
ncbi:MAG: hypothetical protein HKN77_09415 [Woeseiaceae bacterium]|nr:hypothetical protein [Woeseiaceae bacterium]